MPTYPLLFPCPIPVGHRVRITWFESAKAGLFGGRDGRPLEPIVEDLDTRVVYTPAWIFQDDSIYTPQTRPTVSDTPRPDLRQSDTQEGVVAACRIVPVSTKQFTATYLTLDEAPAR